MHPRPTARRLIDSTGRFPARRSPGRHGTPSSKGVKVQPLLLEELFFIAPVGTALPSCGDGAIALSALRDTEPLLPGRTHFLRQLIDSAFAQAGVQPRVTAEIESVATLREAIAAGLGATILPWAVANTFSGSRAPVVRRVVEPTIQATVSLCVPDQNQMSDSGLAVADILAQLVRELASSGQAHGIREAVTAN